MGKFPWKVPNPADRSTEVSIRNIKPVCGCRTGSKVSNLEDEGRTLLLTPLILRGVYYLKDCERVEKGGTGKSLKVFIGMKVPRGDQTLEHMADLLVEYACASGYHPLVAYREIARRQLAKPAEFMLWVRDWIGDSDLILILYHPELRGGLIETGIAYAQNKPIWLISQMDMKVSSSARGCANRLLFYSDPEDLKDQLQAAFGQLTGPDSAVGRSMEETI